LLSDAPSLSDVVVDGEDFDHLLKSFVSQCAPVTAKAKVDHAYQLKLLEQPWWRKLDADDGQDKDIVDDIEGDRSWKVF